MPPKMSLKDKITRYFTRPRFISSYGSKKRLLAVFLIIINVYIYTVLSYGIISTYSIQIQPKESSVVIEVIQAKEEEEVIQEEEVSSSPSPEVTLEDKIRKLFPEDPEVMLAIAKAESGLNTTEVNRANTNGTIDVGIFQINSVWGYSEAYLKDEDNNLEVAREVYDTQGITAWAVYNNKKYLKYLK
jgi:hypothetical protein